MKNKLKDGTILYIIRKGGLALDDNKEQGQNTQPKELNPDVEAAVKAKDALSKYDKKEDYSEDELKSELERLTVLFRDELNKTLDEAENSEGDTALFEDVKELDEIKEQIEKDIIPEDMLCRCCSERARDISRGEDYEYCERCREGMRRYPIGIQYLVFAVAAVFLSVFSVFLFLKNFNAMYQIRQAEKLVSNSKITSAASKYGDAASAFEDAGLNAKRVKLKAVSLSYDSISSFGTLSTLSSQLDSILTSFEYRLFWNSRYYEMRNELLTISATLTAYTEIASEYQQQVNFPYDIVISRLEELIGKTTEIAAPKSDGNSLLSAPAPDKTITVEYSEVFIKFCQYLMLYQKGGEEDLTPYLEEIRELAPKSVWLYGYELGIDYAQSGNYDEALKISDVLFEKNKEDQYAYVIKSIVYRRQKDYVSAEKACDEGIEYCGELSELRRLKAITCILTEKYTEALDIMSELVDTSKTQTLYIETIFTYLIAAELAENKEAASAAKDMLDYYGIEYSKRLQSYLKGELSAEQLFTSGSCDVID